jgi:hypothetical protein
LGLLDKPERRSQAGVAILDRSRASLAVFPSPGRANPQGTLREDDMYIAADMAETAR